jgi:Ca2+-binding RTX toxin-like protein
MDNVENLTATGSGNTYLGGNALNNVLTGNSGNNFMRGDGGNDSLNGGAGHDTAGFALPGGTAGTLRVVQGDNGTLLVQLVHEDGSFEDVFVVTPTGNGSATVTGVGLMAGQGTDTVSNVENLDFFIDNWPTPREPGESVGVPLSIYVPQSPDFLHVSGSVGSDSINLGAIYPDVTVGTPVNASGGFGDDTIIGTAGDNYLVGEAGSDVINGAGGWDTAAFHLPRGTTGTLRFVEDEDGQVRVELVQADGTFETVFEVTFTGDGTATVTGVGMVAALGTDTVTVENLHFSVESWPAQPAEGQSIGMSIASYAPPVDENGFAHVSGSPAGDTIDLAALYPDADAENNINASGGGGNDTILGTAGQNHISGGFGNDTLQGLAGNDFLHGDEGNDTIQGGADNDWMSGGVGDDSLDGGAGTNDIAGFMLPEGMVGDLRVVNGTGANAGMLVVQRVNGGTVEDLFLVSVDQSGTATVTGINSAAHLGTDTISGVEQLHFFPQNAPPGVQFTSIAIRVGGPGDEQINGFGNADIMLGGTGNDTLRGFAGDDAIRGGEGNDIVIGGGGNDYLDGGAGYDRAAYGGASNGVTVDLNLQGQAQNTGQGMDILVGIENVNGSNFNDVLVGDGGDNWLLGLAGNDTISGGAGNDLIDVGAGDHMLDGGAGNDTLVTFSGASLVGAVNISLALQGAAQNTGQGSMILTGIENLSGSNFNDALTGDEGNNIVGGDHGDDTLAGGAGNDQLYGDGFAYFSGDAPGATWIEDGSAFGAVGNDTLQGGAGNDTLIGGGGNDLLDGGEGSDTAIFLLPTETAGTYSLVPGQGLDAGKTLVVLTYNGMSSVVAQITSAGGVITVTGVDLGESLGADTLTDVETITFGTQGQSSGAVSLQLASGVVADGLVAGATVFMDANGDGKWQPGEATTTTAEDGTFMFLTNGSGPLVVVGGINTDTGLPNLVTLSAPAGSTVVNPLTTLVQAILDSPSSDPDLTPQGAAEMVAASLGISANIDLLNTDVFSAAAAGDTQALQAQAAAAIIVSILVTATDAGGATAGTQVLENLAEMVVEDRQSPEAAGVDLTQAAAIEDALAGALAPDQIAQVTPGLVEAAGEISAADSLAEMSEAQAEALTTGNDLDNVLTGGSMNDELFGFGGNDRLSGNGGDDRLAGGAGDDLLDGGAGNDTATYDGAAAGVTVSLAIAGAQNTIGAGLDTLLNLENLIGSGFDDHLTGNSGDNRLEGNAGNDVLSGAAGNDLLIGGIGADRLDGGLGNDTADYSNSAAAVSINLVAGKHAGGDATGDTLSSIENVTGSAFDDRLVGDQNGNVLIGGAGNDVINGGGGMDVLWGGAGSDLFVFKTAAEAGSGASGDKIMDFEAGGVGLSLATDRIDLSAIDAIAGSKKDDSFTFIGDRGFTGKAGELQVLTQNGVATVSGDVNGDGKADFSFTVQYTGSLDASDFLF